MSTIANLGAMGIVAIIIAIVATVLAFIFIVPEKRRAQMGAFGKFLHDTCNFKYLIVEKILQALYIFATAYVILAGFFMLFMAPQDWFTGTRHWLGGRIGVASLCTWHTIADGKIVNIPQKCKQT